MHARRRTRWVRVSIGLFIILTVLTAVIIRHSRGKTVSAAELSSLETRVLGQSRWLAGGPASLRIIVSDHKTGKPVHADVKLALQAPAKGNTAPSPTPLFKAMTNTLGTVDAKFTVPDVAVGNYTLIAEVKTRLGTDRITQPVELTESVQVLLTADKPLYQPGQTMHLRALALDMGTRQAVTGQKLTLEVEDARGNKVFKKTQPLSKFGIAAADFTLASEVNMGLYTVRALLPHGQAEKKVRVERYVLPKFKVALTTEKAYYLPGETARGSVQADYFFGKPVAGSEVTIDVSTIDIGVNKLAELRGKTDENGTYKFEYELPKSFAGQPFEQGKAMVEFHAMVTDTADHLQGAYTSVPVVKDPVMLVIVPENRALVPGVDNRVFIAAATPDGTPLKGATLQISTNLTRTMFHQTTDDLGLATFSFIPNNQPVSLTVRVTTEDGRRAIVNRKLDTSPSEEGIILRASKSLVKAGERITVSTLSTTKRGTVYLDVIRNRQTIYTRALDVKNGEADVSFTVSADMVGTLELRAYKILPNEDIIRDTRVLIVTPANDLTIRVEADKDTYRPGEDAVLHFTVKDANRHPILTALGVAIVDESVYALSELQPGLEKIYFTLEKELMEPKYEIHGLTPADLVLGKPLPVDPAARETQRQHAAEMLFAAVPGQGDFDFRVNTYQQRWEKLQEKIAKEMENAHKRIANAIRKYQKDTGQQLTAEQSLFYLVERGYLKTADLRDHWGNFFRTDLHGSTIYTDWFILNSAGPDGKWGTGDDITGVGMPAIETIRGARFMNVAKADGMVLEDRPMAGAAAMPAMAPRPEIMAKAPAPTTALAKNMATGTGKDEGAAQPAVRLREYFPETMYWNPALITDEHGKAELRIPMADSITTWRMSLFANSAGGQMGSATAPLRVFQDFFVDIDLPVSLTQNDSVSIPVAVYNYLPETQTVKLTLEEADWFTLDTSPEQEVTMKKGEVRAVYFPITVKKIGRFPLTVRANGTKMSDAIRRSIDVLPDGKEIRTTVNDRLDGKVTKTVTIPKDAIDGASTIWVKLYPGTFSQVVEGLDGLLRMPSGCFEQTSSTTYPNVLVLNYLKQNKKINPELQMKAEGYINAGYQRLVTFECKSGGFSWFGDEPANQVLTAYGLLEFSDMGKVHEVDPKVISRTQNWLAGRQQADGTWPADQGGIAEGIIDRQTGTLRTTAYLAWALAESGYTGSQVNKAVQYVKAHRSEAKDPYTLAVILNLLTITDRNGEATSSVANSLIEIAKQTDKTAYWSSGDTRTFTGARSEGADLETTGLAAFGLAKWGRNSGFVSKVLTYLVQSKDSYGTWSTTQGTVWSLKALLYAGSNAMGGGGGTVTVTANGKTAETFTITAADSDVMRQVDLLDLIEEGENDISLTYKGDGSLLYQIVGRYYLPWEVVEKMPEGQAPMSIEVKYDKTTLAQNDTATVTVTIRNLTRAMVEMPLIDVGLPPGFTLVPDGLEEAVQKKTISKYTPAARQIIIYLEKLEPGKTVTLTYALKAKYPIKARTPDSKAYAYYNPEKAARSAPQRIVVQK
ncbi:MAG: MG2 domain-containing protein [Armatimonadota bacterium]